MCRLGSQEDSVETEKTEAAVRLVAVRVAAWDMAVQEVALEATEQKVGEGRVVAA